MFDRYKVYDMGYQRYRDEKIRVCGKYSNSLLQNIIFVDKNLFPWIFFRIEYYNKKFVDI